MQHMKYWKYIKMLNEHHIRASLLREFLGKGLTKPAMMSIEEELKSIGYQAALLQRIYDELKEEYATEIVPAEG